MPSARPWGTVLTNFGNAMPSSLQSLAPDLWVIGYPLKTLGADLRRNVSIIRLLSGKLVIHSTAPFTPEDIAAIKTLGEPGWLLDALLRHDTFAKEGRAAFPDIPYLAPAGFSKELDFSIEPLLPPPAEWSGELDVLEIAGAPEFGEHVVLHRASRTLIVADLVVNFGPGHGLWSEILLNVATIHGEHAPGVTKPFKKAITDEAAFKASITQLLTWDFDRIIVGHGDVLESGAREKLRVALQEAGCLE